jgi:16S rRNA (cytosine967-C5)-methyltransferase
MAGIELLNECEASWVSARPLPADIIINHYFKARRYIGSKDRGAIAALVYYIIRHRATLSWWCDRHHAEKNGRALAIAAQLLHEKITLIDLHNICNGDAFSPAKLSAAEVAFAKLLEGKDLLHDAMPDHVRYNYPQWVEEELKASLGDGWKDEIAALSTEAPVDLRTNTLLATRDQLIEALRAEGYEVEPTPHSPLGVRMKTRAPIFTSACFKRGWFEMQDEGSQLVALLAPVKPGDKVIDFCAGAGGKTLALAAAMQNKGRILAWDTSQKRLDQMKPRLARAKADNVQRHTLASENDPFVKRHKDSADCVLIDAPCSGLGTWRRNPDLKWRFHESDLREIHAIQARILDSASRLVKRGGYLLYVTCSLLQSENEKAIAAFLTHQKKFRVADGEKIWSNFSVPTIRQDGVLRLTPHQDGTDGFFAYLLQRCE